MLVLVLRVPLLAILTGIETEVTLGFSIAGTSEEDDVLASRGLLGQLVEGQALALSSEDSVFGGGGELQGADLDAFGEVKQSHIVGDSADHSHGSPVELSFALRNGSVIFGEVFGDARDGDGEAVESGLVETFVDDVVEVGFSASCEEGVELSVC